MISAAALVKGLDSMFMMNALAQPSGDDDYKALVCVFLFGGNDANNIVIPYTNYAGYDAIRGGVVNLAIPQDQILQITPPSDGNVYGLHPQLGTGAFGGLYQLWNDGKAGIVVNTGPLQNPNYTKADYVAGRGRPYQLFSHSDQQTSWQTSGSFGPVATGWGGRIADRLRGTQSFPVITSIAGVNVFSAGQLTRPLIIGAAPARLDQVLNINRTTDLSSLGQIVAFDQGEGRATLVQASSAVTQDALDQRSALIAAGDPTLTTAFPATGIGNQLKQVAKVIKLVPSIPGGVNRQVFFVSIGGFDTHNNQGKVGGTQGNLWQQVSEAVSAFYQATIELGVSDKVTTFTLSDFSRTMKPANPGGNVGTDHAWGSHQFVVGGAVNGGDFYGRYPTVDALGSDEDFDTGSNPRGRWIPTQGVDQYGATLANWYGLQPADLTYAFPNIGVYSTSDLGFMQAPAGAANAGKNLVSRAMRL